MNTVQKCLFGGTLIGAGLSSQATADMPPPVTADITIGGNLSIVDDGGGYDNGLGSYSYAFASGVMSIDVWNFTVLSDGLVDLDILSFDYFDTYFDGSIWLFENDGNPFSYAENYIATNDDTRFGYDLNGSVSGYDSFLDIFLTAGEYSIAVGYYEIDIESINNGEYEEGNVWTLGGNGIPTSAQYQLDIYGDVALGVPAPGALALLGLGGLVSTRRRR